MRPRSPAGPDTLPGQTRAPLPACAKPRDGSKATTRDAPAARPTCRPPCPPQLREWCQNRGILSPDPPRAQGGDKKDPSLLAVTSPITGVAGRKADHGTGLGRAITGQLKKIPMFVQVSLYRKHCARARDRVQQPVRADRGRLPPAGL